MLISFAAIGSIIMYALLRYIIGGEANLNPANNYMDRGVLTHFPLMVIAGFVSLAGLAVILGKRSDDFLRWTPTGQTFLWVSLWLFFWLLLTQ